MVRDPSDPFAILVLDSSAGVDDVISARRRLAKRAHPDVGGDDLEMQRINAAVGAALGIIADRQQRAVPMSPTSEAPIADADRPSGGARSDGPPTRDRRRRVVEDHPSFTIGALPVVAHAALLAVADDLGTVVIDEPPYLIETEIDSPSCWCRLEILPEAGSSSIGLTVSGADPDVEAIRDLWIERLNRLDWTAFGER